MNRKLWTSAVLLAAITGTGALSPARAPAQSRPPASSPTASSAFDASAILSDNNAPPALRDEAARRLLSRHTDGAREQLRNALVEPNTNGQGAVARALAEDAQPDPSFIDPLFPLLQNDKLANYAGRALSGYKGNPEVLTRLISSAANRRAPDWTRVSCIRAIGTMAEKRAAATLIDLVANSPDDAAFIHTSAADALVNLTGMEQNGQDPMRWSKWWAGEQNRSEADFRQSIELRKAARLDRLNARYGSLLNELNTLLHDQYRATASKDRETLVLRLLNSSEPDVRKISAEIVRDAFLEDATVTDGEKQRLRDMIGDSTPAVRRAAADALSKINDAGAIDALLAQLASEPDPTVRAAIATALGPIHNLKAVPTLLDLLGDDSLPTAKAAARALAELAQHGGLANDADLNRKTSVKLRDTILRTMHTPGAEDLRAACVEALAPLKQSDIVQELLNDKLLDAGKEPSWSVRKYMLQALAELNDKKWADWIARGLDDQVGSVKLQAIQSLSMNPSAADWANRVWGMLDPAVERDESVRDAAWTFMLSVFPLPQIKAQQLQAWADALKNQPGRQVLTLQFLADKQQRAGQQDDLAISRQSIGLAYLSLKQFGDAAASFKAALDLNNTMPGMMRDSLERDYMKSLLQGGKFPEAVGFAADRIKADQQEQSTMGSIIVRHIDERITSGRREDLAAARQLLDLARKMTPPLGEKYQRQLDSLEADLKQRAPN